MNHHTTTLNHLAQTIADALVPSNTHVQSGTGPALANGEHWDVAIESHPNDRFYYGDGPINNVPNQSFQIRISNVIHNYLHPQLRKQHPNLSVLRHATYRMITKKQHTEAIDSLQEMMESWGVPHEVIKNVMEARANTREAKDREAT